jgi:hypothetical protein
MPEAPAPKLVRIRVPSRYGTFEDAHGVSHKPGSVIEVTERTASLYGLEAVKEALAPSPSAPAPAAAPRPAASAPASPAASAAKPEAPAKEG